MSVAAMAPFTISSICGRDLLSRNNVAVRAALEPGGNPGQARELPEVTVKFEGQAQPG